MGSINIWFAIGLAFVAWYAVTSYRRGWADGYDKAIEDIEEEAERMMQEDESDD